MVAPTPPLIIDALQYCRYGEEVFHDFRAGGVSAAHVTIAYHEDFRETVDNIIRWNAWFETYAHLIFPGREAADVGKAKADGRTAIFFGLQTPAPIEDNIGLVEICYRLGIRFMQLSYNNQSLLASGCYEAVDAGISRMGREVIAEMNRLGMIIDMSHSGERSTLEAIALSKRPIAITHANPRCWHDHVRNKSDTVLKALAASGGMLGFSLYPLHLKDGSACRLADFCAMVARTAERIGVDALGLGTDLCQGQPDSVVQWMREGTWTRNRQAGVGFAPALGWFASNRDFGRLAGGLADAGFSANDIAKIMGRNWLRFFERGFGPAMPVTLATAAERS